MSYGDRTGIERMAVQHRHANPIAAARQQVEDDIDRRYAEAHEARPRRGLVRMRLGDWAVDQLIDNQLLEGLHVNQLRRISEAMGHPFKGDLTKSVVDMVDLAVERLGKAAV